MNYYQRHIGDYAAATRHLTLMEHGAYTILLDLYYTNEKPLPVSQEEIFKKVNARQRSEKNSVSLILNEFFELRDDGYHHKRCDEEISQYLKKADKNRANGAKGGRPPKTQMVSENNPNGLFEDNQAVNSKHESENPNQEPLTNNHNTKLNTLSITSQVVGANTSDENESENKKEIALNVQIAIAMRNHGINCQSANPKIIALAQQGIDIDTINAACEEAKSRKPNEEIPLGYVIAILNDWAKQAQNINVKGAKAPQAKTDNWFSSKEGIERKGRELGLAANAGEDYPSFKARIERAIERKAQEDAA